MITAFWTHERLFEAPNCISTSFLIGDTSLNALGKKLCEEGEYILSFITLLLLLGTEPANAPVELLSGRRVCHYSKFWSVQIVILSGNKYCNVNQL